MIDWYAIGKQQRAETVSAREIEQRFDKLVWDSKNAAEFQDPEATSGFAELMNTPESQLASEFFEKRDLYARWTQSVKSEAQMFAEFARGWLESNPLKVFEVAAPAPGELTWSTYDYDTYSETTAFIWRDVPGGKIMIVFAAKEDGKVFEDGRREAFFHHATYYPEQGKGIELDCYQFPQIKLISANRQ